MPTDKEREAATWAVRLLRFKNKATFLMLTEGSDISHYEEEANAALEAAEKVRGEATTKREEKLREVLESEDFLIKVQYEIHDATPEFGRCKQCTTNNKYFYLRAKAAINVFKQALQQTEED